MIYILIFTILIIVWFLNQKKYIYNENLQKIFFYFIFFLIAFRSHVGGDYIVYDHAYNESYNYDLFEYIQTYYHLGFLYSFLSWIFYHNNFSSLIMNIIASSIFIFGLYNFISKQHDKLLALIISFPFYIIIFGMGFTRQSLSCGILLLLLSKKWRNFYSNFIILISVGMHHSSIIFYILNFFHKDFSFNEIIRRFFSNKIIHIFYFIILILSSFVIFFFIKKFYLTIYLSYFSDSVLPSKGAYVRCGLTFIASVIYLFYYNNFNKFNNLFSKFWLTISIYSILVYFLIIVFPSFSTIADRLNYFFVPLQLYVFSNLNLLIEKEKMLFFSKIVIISIYFILFLVWLFYSEFSQFWLPYNLTLEIFSNRYALH